MIPAIQAAKYFLSLCDEDAGDSLTNLKLQKLLYYAQGVHLAMHGKLLFPDAIRAWTHGPVVPSLYHELKEHGASPVSIPDSELPGRLDPDTKQTLDEVFSVFGQFSAWKLRDMTHAEPPWKDTPLNGVISHSRLKEYFLTQIDDDDEEEEA